MTDTTPEAVERLARKNETRTWTRPHAPLMTITEPEPLGVETADALRTLLRERDEARASVAAAYEAAADVLLDRGTNVEDPIAVRKDILALTPADAKTALDRLIAEARHAHRELVGELEAKLAKAVEALEQVQAFVRDLEPYAEQGHTLVPALEKACLTLKEITGDKT